MYSNRIAHSDSCLKEGRLKESQAMLVSNFFRVLLDVSQRILRAILRRKEASPYELKYPPKTLTIVSHARTLPPKSLAQIYMLRLID